MVQVLIHLQHVLNINNQFLVIDSERRKFKSFIFVSLGWFFVLTVKKLVVRDVEPA